MSKLLIVAKPTKDDALENELQETKELLESTLPLTVERIQWIKDDDWIVIE